jgi:hypothetical protein
MGSNKDNYTHQQKLDPRAAKANAAVATISEKSAVMTLMRAHPLFPKQTSKI